ncbi:bifunctional 2-keto-4-hydroxyglutarate aldolase/2-keto-3-deoxy-6-phosphogluconate aldolase [Halarsenatibacter silvermanii]|uniref:2-keto-3-deoxy-phosphogluconate aldolase n=1 Tax=Halarsenatibacter silvermanii TaxID=321763 RepID=A0A1G9SFV0_9FIRM|nr:bifunctional 2-keto-4-hydroxyglutarate aldolase/2-keto-3-deoxy-6-phosphogluconate aldolase [Halarsenatibacter silvermanii]SDM34319.1 2-keto-3-deoxy-phosphogluconate aldolase [Halarsenatibacter silvermanii]
MKKRKTLEKIKECGIVPVIRAESAGQAKKITEAVKDGGINVIEITMTVPGAIDVIDELTEEYGNNTDLVFGAGSVMDGETTRNAILAGAEFIVGPALDEGMIEVANRYQKPVVPGAMTPTEVKKAMEAGADIVKIFPASMFGPKIIKAIKGPIPQAELIPTGGVDHDNVKDWINAGSFAVGAGSAIVSGAKEDDYQKVQEDAARFVELIEEARA